MGQGNTQNIRSSSVNLSESMGKYGSFPITDNTTKNFGTDAPDQSIVSIDVLTGTVDVSGEQYAHDNTLSELNQLPDWSTVTIGVGVHMTPLKNAVVDTTSGTCIVYYGE